MPRHREYLHHLEAFEVWYQANRSFRITSEKLGKANNTLRDWALWFDWKIRADERDAEAIALAEKEAIARRVEMLRRHRQAGELLVRRGVEHFVRNQIEKAADATAAIKAGVDLERTAEGMPAWVTEVLNADADTIAQRIAELESRRREALAGVETPPGGVDPEEPGEKGFAAMVSAPPDSDPE
jgi:prefoldin subunit 5